MTTTATGQLDTASAVLAFARERRSAADRAEADLLQAAVSWAVMHPAESIVDAATFAESFGETAVPVAGPGAPLVAEFSIPEFAAAVGMPTEVGKAYLGEAVELRYRLPLLYGRVVAGNLPAWRARRIARATIVLSVEAAAHVDRHVAPVAHKVGKAVTERLVAEAIARFMPEEAERRRRAAADGRHFTIGVDQVSFAGTMNVSGELDLADALDLDAAVATVAGQLKDLGCAESLDVRRSMAVGEIARHQASLDLTTDGTHDGATPDGGAGGAGPSRRDRRCRRRAVVIHAHVSQTALTGGHRGPDGCVVRVENRRQLVTAEQLRTWCGNRDAQITVLPVLDLAEQVATEAYEVPDRIAAQADERDLTCVFPYCRRPARSLDHDHVIPWPRGQTTTGNIAPLCRHHHRLKTHGGWACTVLEPGAYLWRSRHGYTWLRDHTGTQDVTDIPDHPGHTDRAHPPDR